MLLPLAWIVLIRLVKGDPKKVMFYLAIVVILITISFRFSRFSQLQPINSGIWDLGFRKQVITRVDGIMVGVITAYLWSEFKMSLIHYRKGALVLGLASFFGIRLLEIIDRIPVAGWYDSVFSFTIFAIGTALLIPSLMMVDVKNRLLIRSFTFISLTSYSMYLVNLTLVQHLIIGHLPWNIDCFPSKGQMILNYILFWILTIGISTLLFHFFERPILKFRDKK